MTSQALVVQHRRSLQQVQTLLDNDLVEIYSGIPKSPAAAMSLLISQLPQLTSIYGDMAATLAVDWYETVREAAGAGGFYSGILAPELDPGRAIILAKWGSEPLWQSGDLELSRSRISGGAQRMMAGQSRETVMRNVDKDKAATGRWARDARASGCAFCLMLASRGPVYTSQDVGDFNAHDSCYCVAVPDFDDYEEPPHLAEFRETYTDARDSVGGRTSDILSELRTTTGAA